MTQCNSIWQVYTRSEFREAKLPVTHITVSIDYISVTLPTNPMVAKNKSKRKNAFYSCSAKNPDEVTSPCEWAVSPFQLSVIGVTILH